MRKLHLVGLTTDRDGLIFTARKGSKSGGYIVPLDDAVLAAVAEIQADRNGAGAGDAEATEVEAVPRRPRHQSALTPREMQARLRAGRSIEEVAAEAGVESVLRTAVSARLRIDGSALRLRGLWPPNGLRSRVMRPGG